jgi:hypothetical protein
MQDKLNKEAAPQPDDAGRTLKLSIILNLAFFLE